MDNKVRSTLDKVRQDRAKGNYDRALKRLGDLVRSHPDEIEIYQEATETAIDAGESIQGIQYLKKALARFAPERDALIAAAREKARDVNDPILAKFLLEFAVKRREIAAARATADNLQERTARDLLQRTRMKRQTLSSAAHGGHSVSGEILTNMMSEALLCLRLARTDEALNVLTEVLDGHHEETETVEPLLASLAGEASAPGRALLLQARCCAASSRPAEAIGRLVDAVKRDPALGHEALDLLRELSSGVDTEPGSVDRPLVTILLITGEHARVVDLLRPQIERYPDTAGEVLELLEPFGNGDGNDPNGLRVLYLDAAVAADRMATVQETIEAMRGDESLHAPLLEWLEDRSRDRFFTPGIMTTHAELALEAERFDRAAEILRAVATTDAEAAPHVCELIEAYVERSPELAALRDELDHQPAAQETSQPTATPGAAFEHFENQEFNFSSNGSDAGFDVEEEHATPPVTPDSGNDARVLDGFDVYDGTRLFQADDDNQEHGAAVDDDAPEVDLPDEGFVLNLGQALYTAGARTFFHVEFDDGNAPATSPSPEPAATADAADAVPPEPEPVDELADAPVAETAETTPTELAPIAEAADTAPTEPAPVELADAPVAETAETTPPEPAPIAEAADATPTEPAPIDELADAPVAETAETTPPEPAPIAEAADAGPTEPAPVDELVDAHLAESTDATPTKPTPTAEVTDAAPTEPAPVEESVDAPVAEATETTPTEPAPTAEVTDAAPTETTPVEELVDAHLVESTDAAPTEPTPVEELVDVHLAESTDATPTRPASTAESTDATSTEPTPTAEAAEATATEATTPEPTKGVVPEETDAVATRLRDVEERLARQQPRVALAILQALQDRELSEDERRSVRLKTVACHRSMKDYDTAHRALVELIKLYPGDREIEQLTKQNYEQYLEQQSNDTPILEKVTSLDGDQ